MSYFSTNKPFATQKETRAIRKALFSVYVYPVKVYDANVENIRRWFPEVIERLSDRDVSALFNAAEYLLANDVEGDNKFWKYVKKEIQREAAKSS